MRPKKNWVVEWNDADGDVHIYGPYTERQARRVAVTAEAEAAARDAASPEENLTGQVTVSTYPIWPFETTP